MVGRSQLLSLCRGQAVIALSSGEAEYYGLVTASSEGLRLQSMAKDFGIAMLVHIWMDATAGQAIGSRRGLGRVKHISTVFLWVQDLINRKAITIGKKHTSENLADILTKAVEAFTLNKFIREMGFRHARGESDMAIKA